jgi:hypothetical protein
MKKEVNYSKSIKKQISTRTVSIHLNEGDSPVDSDAKEAQDGAKIYYDCL